MLTMTKPHEAKHARLTTVAAALALAGALGLSGCGSTKPPTADLGKVHQFESQGYPAAHEYTTVASEELRLIGGQPARLVWLQPQAEGEHPLVIYMPGLGQDAHAFALGRQQLAQAGYAVLSWQPLPEDGPAKQGERLHDGDAKKWAGQRHEASQLQRRSDLLLQLTQMLSDAQTRHEPLLQHVDLKHISLAGFDLGAYTVMHAAGEKVIGATRPAALPVFSAYIVISPYANLEQGGFESRYKAVKGPILTLTSDNDTDPNGLVPAAYLRTAPFGGMPTQDKYMLIFSGLRHGALGEQIEQGGGIGPGPDGEPGQREGRGRSDSDGSGGSGGPGGQGGPGGGKGGGHGSGGPGGSKGPGDGGAASSPSPTRLAMQQTAEGVVCTAFLDAYALNDQQARQWLDTRAIKWLAPIGDWLSK
jgi:dienelactone hydrolase